MLSNLLFIWSRLPRRTEIKKGAFLCPHCESRQPCTGFTQMRRKNYEGEFVECDTCQGKQRGEDYRFDAVTSTFEPRWECPYCKAMNPNNTFRCRSCHKSLV